MTGDLLLLAVAVIWGSSYLAAKTLTVAGGVLVVLALRYLVSMAALLPLAVTRRPGRRELGVGVLLGCTQASVLVLETYGVSLTSATNAGVLISLTILLTALMQGGLPGRFLLAAGTATAGVALLVAGPGLRAGSAGDALILAAAVVRAAHVTLSGRLARPGYDTVTLTTVQTVVGAVVFGAAAGPALLPTAAGFGTAQWLGVLYLALGCSVFAFLVQLWAIRRTSAARASLLLGTEPVWAVLIGVGVGGEHLTGTAVAGIGLVLAGVYWGQRVERSSRARTAAALSTAASRDRSASAHGSTTLTPDHSASAHGSTTPTPDHSASAHGSTTPTPDHSASAHDSTTPTPNHSASAHDSTTPTPNHSASAHDSTTPTPNHSASAHGAVAPAPAQAPAQAVK
ncbi:DMT family transporter [Actinoplanes flavus]|uniref:DMT family transporter n=1 Tax=Actinoplanes flavus TaxID=2820290 RepID=UPI0027DE24CF|nr:EamA family transporter [Actinoplanes flavus]